MTSLGDTLPDDPATLKAMVLAERARADRLAQILKEMQRHRFGRRAETLPLDQLELGLEDTQQTEAAEAARDEKADPDRRKVAAAKRRANRGSLPAHLPRIESVVDIGDKTCPCCSGALHLIGEDRAERLDIVPAQFRVLVIRRPKYACRTCEDLVIQAQAPARLIEGGLPTEALVAHVVTAKYADHLPLYRQAQIYARQLRRFKPTIPDGFGRRVHGRFGGDCEPHWCSSRAGSLSESLRPNHLSCWNFENPRILSGRRLKALSARDHAQSRGA